MTPLFVLSADIQETETRTLKCQDDVVDYHLHGVNISFCQAHQQIVSRYIHFSCSRPAVAVANIS